MDNLLDEIRDYLHNHGHYPKVKVSREFYWSEGNFDDFTRIEQSDIELEINETVDQWELE